MKVCPKCGKSYDDESLNFCLDDGSVLNRMESGAGTEPPPTVMMPQGEITEQLPAQPTQPTFESPVHTQYTMPARRSRSWIWVLVILFGVALLCGGGFAGLIAIGSLNPDDENSASSSPGDNKAKIKEDGADESADLIASDDMSTWPRELRNFSDLEYSYKGDELHISTKRGYFYVISTGERFKTRNSSVKVTVRNPTGRSTNFGYGLVVHSDPSAVLKRDFAFLIQSDDQKYRIVEHENKKESVLVNWTTSRAINRGTRANELEVRSDGSEMSFFINGEPVKTVTDRSGYNEGVAGIYTSDDIPIAFSKLELRK